MLLAIRVLLVGVGVVLLMSSTIYNLYKHLGLQKILLFRQYFF